MTQYSASWNIFIFSNIFVFFTSHLTDTFTWRMFFLSLCIIISSCAIIVETMKLLEKEQNSFCVTSAFSIMSTPKQPKSHEYFIVLALCWYPSSSEWKKILFSLLIVCTNVNPHKVNKNKTKDWLWNMNHKHFMEPTLSFQQKYIES